MPSALGWLNLLIPKDSGSRRVARGVSYGPHPRHRLDLFAPKQPNGPSPLLVFFYGGSWNSGDRSEYSFAGRAFAALGFLTIVMDYRIVPEVRFPAFVEDGALAANWLLDHAHEHGGDPSRVVIAGHSAGAYNAAMLALQPARFGSPQLAGRVKGLIGLSGPYDFYPFDVPASVEAFGQWPDPESTQPVNVATAGAPPAFLAHGDRDISVRPRNTIALAARLRALGVPVTEKHYALDHPGTALNLMVPLRGMSPMFADMAAFLSQR